MALPITPELVDRAAEGLAASGWRYTPRQLYYATCAAAETPPPSSRAVSSSIIGFGAIVVLVSLIVVSHRIAFVALLSAGAAVILLGLVERIRPPPALSGRVLAISYPDFISRFGSQPRGGLLEMGTGQPEWMVAGAETVVFCDASETAALVNANVERAGLQSAVAVDAASMPDSLHTVRVVALHDASPAGCALPVRLHELGLGPVIDAGLRPGAISTGRYQVIEGAPARMQADLSGRFGSDEIAWLASGRRLELAVFTPEQILGMVAGALSEG